MLFIYNANLDKQLLGFKVVGVHTATVECELTLGTETGLSAPLYFRTVRILYQSWSNKPVLKQNNHFRDTFLY